MILLYWEANDSNLVRLSGRRLSGSATEFACSSYCRGLSIYVIVMNLWLALPPKTGLRGTLNLQPPTSRSSTSHKSVRSSIIIRSDHHPSPITISILAKTNVSGPEQSYYYTFFFSITPHFLSGSRVSESSFLEWYVSIPSGDLKSCPVPPICSQSIFDDARPCRIPNLSHYLSLSSTRASAR
jgi:hypothetical protein